MPVKIAEKQLFPGLGLLITSAAVLSNTTVFSAPVTVSEKGLLIDLLAIGLFYYAIRFLSGSIHRP
jgi:hypothetical protein